jgi:hypothetical protein
MVRARAAVSRLLCWQHLKYLHEYVPAFNAKVEELEAAVEAGLDDTLQRFAERAFEREYDDDDDSKLWVVVCDCGVSSCDEFQFIYLTNTQRSIGLRHSEARSILDLIRLRVRLRVGECE